MFWLAENSSIFEPLIGLFLFIFMLLNIVSDCDLVPIVKYRGVIVNKRGKSNLGLVFTSLDFSVLQLRHESQI